MSGKPAARLGDPTAHGNPLAPGIGSLDVLIANKPAWRGMSPAMVGQLLQMVEDIAKDVTKALEAPDAIAKAKFVDDVVDGVAEVGKLMGATDQHACAVVKLLIPDGNGVVITGSPTVLINNLPACRMGDMIQEATNVNSIAGGEPTVLIGGSAQAGAMSAAKRAGAPFVEICDR